MNRKNILFLLIIFIVSFTLRIYQTSVYPPMLWDEASLGYNAFSILKTGKDEYGKFFPLIFKSFGDYKPGLYIYLTVPFVYLFGLNPLSVRLPSIILGSFLPIILYLLILQLSPKSKKFAYIAAILLAFNPYNIHFSRGAWETNILTFELVLASYLFFKYLNSKTKIYLLASSITFGLTLFTYQAGKMISLFLIIIIFLLNFNQIFKNHLKNIFSHFILPLFLFSLPILYGLLFNQNANRLKVISLWSYPRSSQDYQTILDESSQTDYQIFHNHPLFYIQNVANRYFNHFSSRFLVFEGDWQGSRHSAPYYGVLLYPSLIFLFIGIFTGFSSKSQVKRRLYYFFFLWLLVAPIPAALTRDSVQAVRSMSFSIPLIFFSSLGILNTINTLKNKKFLLSTFYCLLFFSYIVSFIYYFELYHNHLVKKNPVDNLFGYQQAIDYVIKNKENFDRIYFSDYHGQPYIYYLFYSQYPPANYQTQALLEDATLDIGHIKTIDNIHFETAQFNFIQDHPGTLGIFSQEEIYRQGIEQTPEFSKFIPLSPINNISTFYAYQNN